jgi:hypothetical protein
MPRLFKKMGAIIFSNVARNAMCIGNAKMVNYKKQFINKTIKRRVSW